MAYGTFICWYADVDGELGLIIKDRLAIMGLHVLPEKWSEANSSVELSKARYVVIVLTPQLIDNERDRKLCATLASLATEREKPVFVLRDGISNMDETLELLPCLSAAIPIDLQLRTADNMFIGITSAIYKMLSLIDAYEEKQRLYDSISFMSPTLYCDHISDHYVRILQSIQNQLNRIYTPGVRKELIKEALGCAEILPDAIEGYNETGRESALFRVDCLNILTAIREKCREFNESDPLFMAIGIRLLYLDNIIRADCADTLTYGDVTCLQAHSLLPLVQKQDDYYAKMKAFLSDHSNTYLAEHYDSSEQELIQDIEGSLLRRSYAFDDSPHGYSKRISNSQQQRSYKEAFSKKPQPLQEYAEADIKEHELLLSIAQCIYDSNQLFDQFVNDNSPMGFLISLRTSYERLSQYCKLIGERDMVAIVCENISSINHQIELGSTADSNPQTDNMPTNGIRTLLGMEKPIHESYDAFISYSHTEEDIASKIYHFLRNSLQEPFFDRTSLPELSDSDYEDAIMEAIDWSRHLILIVSDLATLNSRWVRLEVKTFLHEVREGRKSDGNVLLVVSNAVWDEITRSNKRCLPIILRACEILKLDSYRSTILSYLR